ncbi:hypothetical protein H5410_026730 [Solanum commersonii]|uniref:Uncharacterized protein n=1 Tax=Solanum commersonii TaxID=4109 RepID=A0A9J5Z2C9_SOLCO|nr:hypothetical protein H5410_026730 [Solanum commersonii]
MVMTSLIATMTFQAGMKPQEVSDKIIRNNVVQSSQIVLILYRVNTTTFVAPCSTILLLIITTFVASLSTILLLISGLLLRKKPFYKGFDDSYVVHSHFSSTHLWKINIHHHAKERSKNNLVKLLKLLLRCGTL